EQHPSIIEQTATRQLLMALQQHNCLQPGQADRLIEIFGLYRARSHQRALQEQSSSLNDDEFPEQRNEVKQIWQQLLGDDPGKQV
ncbi:MAG: hypothetical protein OEZ38_05965, partial [Gammaproteobacteria bacterium]|nr:hypothetical protein [Gammaproteobacteria bacterium]